MKSSLFLSTVSVETETADKLHGRRLTPRQLSDASPWQDTGCFVPCQQFVHKFLQCYLDRVCSHKALCPICPEAKTLLEYKTLLIPDADIPPSCTSLHDSMLVQQTVGAAGSTEVLVTGRVLYSTSPSSRVPLPARRKRDSRRGRRVFRYLGGRFWRTHGGECSEGSGGGRHQRERNCCSRRVGQGGGYKPGAAAQQQFQQHLFQRGEGGVNKLWRPGVLSSIFKYISGYFFSLTFSSLPTTSTGFVCHRLSGDWFLSNNAKRSPVLARRCYGPGQWQAARLESPLRWREVQYFRSYRLATSARMYPGPRTKCPRPSRPGNVRGSAESAGGRCGNDRVSVPG